MKSREELKQIMLECNIGNPPEDLYDDAFEDGERVTTHRVLDAY